VVVVVINRDQGPLLHPHAVSTVVCPTRVSEERLVYMHIRECAIRAFVVLRGTSLRQSFDAVNTESLGSRLHSVGLARGIRSRSTALLLLPEIQAVLGTRTPASAFGALHLEIWFNRIFSLEIVEGSTSPLGLNREESVG